MAGAFFIQDHWLTVVTGDRDGGNVFEAGLTVQHFHHNAARFRPDGVATLILEERSFKRRDELHVRRVSLKILTKLMAK